MNRHQQELNDINSYGDERRTEIIDRVDFDDEDLIPEQDMVVTFSQEGYIKTQLLDSYQAQRRGGRGKIAQTKDQDILKCLLIAHSRDTLFLPVREGYTGKYIEVPAGSRQSKGRPIVNCYH